MRVLVQHVSHPGEVERIKEEGNSNQQILREIKQAHHRIKTERMREREERERILARGGRCGRSRAGEQALCTI